MFSPGSELFNPACRHCGLPFTRGDQHCRQCGHPSNLPDHSNRKVRLALAGLALLSGLLLAGIGLRVSRAPTLPAPEVVATPAPIAVPAVAAPAPAPSRVE